MQKASRHGYLDAPAPKENPLPVPVPPGATVVEPRVPDPKENPVAMAALGAKPSARAERPRMLQSPHCRGGMCHISVPSGDREGSSTPSSATARSEGAGPQANACATPPARRTHKKRARRAGDPGIGVEAVLV